MSAAPTAGRLRHRVTILRPPDPTAAARDDFGHQAEAGFVQPVVTAALLG